MYPPPPPSSKNEMLIFGLSSTSDDWLSNPSNESQQNAKKGPLIIKKWNAHFWIMFSFWWLAKWSEQQKLTKMHHWSASEWLGMLISPDSQLFQSFLTKVAQNDLEQPILHGKNRQKQKQKHYDTREFLWKITLLHGQLCHKPYGFLVIRYDREIPVPFWNDCTLAGHNTVVVYAENNLWDRDGHRSYNLTVTHWAPSQLNYRTSLLPQHRPSLVKVTYSYIFCNNFNTVIIHSSMIDLTH